MSPHLNKHGVKQMFFRLVFLSLIVCICLLVCEGVVRVYSHFFFPKMMKIDPALGWYHNANSKKYYLTEGHRGLIVQNNLGHRGPNYGTVKSDGKKRVLILGDSFTEGSHVGEDEVFSGIIANNYPNLEIMNAGVGGYSSVQEYLYLKKFGLDLNPDLVLLLFFENDLTENFLSFSPAIGPRPYASLENGELLIHENPSPKEHLKYVLPIPFAEQFNRYSLAYHFFNFRVYQPLRSSYLIQLEADDEKKTETMPKLEVIGMIYLQIQGLLKERGIKFAVGLIPARADAKRGYSDIQAPLLSFCKAKGIRCLSLVQPLNEAYKKGLRPYFVEDIHWAPDGHRVAAEALGPYIQELLLSPQ